MNILFVSMEGDSLPIAQRVLKEGHRVTLHVEEKNARGIGNGMVEKATPARSQLVPSLPKGARLLETKYSPFSEEPNPNWQYSTWLVWDEWQTSSERKVYLCLEVVLGQIMPN